MESPDELTGPVNLGNPAEATILELAEKIVAMTSSKSKIEFKPLPTDDPRRRRPDISLAKERLSAGSRRFASRTASRRRSRISRGPPPSDE